MENIKNLNNDYKQKLITIFRGSIKDWSKAISDDEDIITLELSNIIYTKIEMCRFLVNENDTTYERIPISIIMNWFISFNVFIILQGKENPYLERVLVSSLESILVDIGDVHESTKKDLI